MADSWGTNDLKEALPSTDPSSTTNVGAELPVEEENRPNPQEYGWAEKQGYDYESYNLTNKEAYEKIATAGVGARGTWASNAAKVNTPV